MKKKLSFLILLSFITLLSCNNSITESPDAKSAIESARQEVLDVIKKQNIKASFDFEAFENDSSLTVVFKNKAVGKQVEFNTRDSTLLLGLYLNKSNNERTYNIYKSQLIRHDATISFEIWDMANNLIEKKEAQIPDDIFDDAPPLPCPVFDSYDDCSDHFYCTEYPELQCEANRTCETIIAGFCCCLSDGCNWYEFIEIKPTDPSCRVRIREIDIPRVKANL
jgi:hypothetical protein